jgi:hypothetical protein
MGVSVGVSKHEAAACPLPSEFGSYCAWDGSSAHNYPYARLLWLFVTVHSARLQPDWFESGDSYFVGPSGVSRTVQNLSQFVELPDLLAPPGQAPLAVSHLAPGQAASGWIEFPLPSSSTNQYALWWEPARGLSDLTSTQKRALPRETQSEWPFEWVQIG